MSPRQGISFLAIQDTCASFFLNIQHGADPVCLPSLLSTNTLLDRDDLWTAVSFSAPFLIRCRDEAQQSALTQFRSELVASGMIPHDTAAHTQQIGYDRFDDQTLLRFLRAREIRCAKGSDHVGSQREMEKGVWDRRYRLVTLSHLPYVPNIDLCSHGFDYPEGRGVDKYYPQFYHRTDKEGRPIYIEQLGKLDIAKLYALTTQERQLRHLVSEYEKFFKDRLPACSETSGQLVETSCTILDLHNAGISCFYKGESPAA